MEVLLWELQYGRRPIHQKDAFIQLTISLLVGFDYILDLVPDKKYGAKDPLTGEWNGMVLQLMKHVSLLSRTIAHTSEKKTWNKSGFFSQISKIKELFDIKRFFYKLFVGL